MSSLSSCYCMEKIYNPLAIVFIFISFWLSLKSWFIYEIILIAYLFFTWLVAYIVSEIFALHCSAHNSLTDFNSCSTFDWQRSSNINVFKYYVSRKHARGSLTVFGRSVYIYIYYMILLPIFLEKIVYIYIYITESNRTGRMGYIKHDCLSQQSWMMHLL